MFGMYLTWSDYDDIIQTIAVQQQTNMDTGGPSYLFCGFRGEPDIRVSQ